MADAGSASVRFNAEAAFEALVGANRPPSPSPVNLPQPQLHQLQPQPQPQPVDPPSDASDAEMSDADADSGDDTDAPPVDPLTAAEARIWPAQKAPKRKANPNGQAADPDADAAATLGTELGRMTQMRNAANPTVNGAYAVNAALSGILLDGLDVGTPSGEKGNPRYARNFSCGWAVRGSPHRHQYLLMLATWMEELKSVPADKFAELKKEVTTYSSLYCVHPADFEQAKAKWEAVPPEQPPRGGARPSVAERLPRCHFDPLAVCRVRVLHQAHRGGDPGERRWPPDLVDRGTRDVASTLTVRA